MREITVRIVDATPLALFMAERGRYRLLARANVVDSDGNDISNTIPVVAAGRLYRSFSDRRPYLITQLALRDGRAVLDQKRDRIAKTLVRCRVTSVEAA